VSAIKARGFARRASHPIKPGPGPTDADASAIVRLFDPQGKQVTLHLGEAGTGCIKLPVIAHAEG